MAAVAATNGHGHTHDRKESKAGLVLALPTPPASGGASPKGSPHRAPLSTTVQVASITALAADTTPPQWWPDVPWKQHALVAWWVVALSFQFAAFVPWTIAVDADGPSLHDRAAPMFGWYFQFLTFVGGYQQIGYFVHCLIDWFAATRACGCCKTLSAARVAHIHASRDKFFTLTFTITSFICITFWAIVYDPDVNTNFPLTFSYHAITGFLIWIELLVVPHRYGKWLPELCMVWAWALLYLGWNYICYAANGDTFPYEFQYDYRGSKGYMYIPMFLLAALFYFVGRLIARFWWDEHNEAHNGLCCLRMPRVAPEDHHQLP